MCPLRFLLVFFSALLAGYFAWKSMGSSPKMDDDDLADESTLEGTQLNEKEGLNLKRVQDGFWVFVDMASGMYLLRNLKDLKRGSNKEDKVNT